MDIEPYTNRIPERSHVFSPSGSHGGDDNSNGNGNRAKSPLSCYAPAPTTAEHFDRDRRNAHRARTAKRLDGKECQRRYYVNPCRDCEGSDHIAATSLMP